MRAEPSLIKNCINLTKDKFTKNINYLVVCPTQTVEIKLYDEFSESKSFFFHFVFLYDDGLFDDGLFGEKRLEDEEGSDKNGLNDILTANITNIDDLGLVTVMFNHNIENQMFNITRKNTYDGSNLPRWL